MFYVREFLDLFWSLAAYTAKMLVFSLQWPGNEEGPVQIQEVVTKKGGSVNFEPQSSTVPGYDPQYTFQTLQTAREASQLGIMLMIGANPILWEYRNIFLVFANTIRQHYEALGITHFHAGFALITKGAA